MGLGHGNSLSWWNLTGGTDSLRTYIATNKVVQSGLVLNLDAGASTSYPGSGTTWTNLVGGGNNGTLTNGPTYSSANGGSIVFDGVNDYVGLGNILNYTTENFTFNTFFYLNTFATSQGGQGPVLFYKGSYQQKGYYCQVSQDGSINFVTNQSGANQTCTTASGIVSLNTWHCVSFVRSGSNVIIYVNGNQSSSSNSHINPTSSSDNFHLCSYNFGIYSNFRISQFSAYNRALSAAEVSQNYNALRGRFGI